MSDIYRKAAEAIYANFPELKTEPAAAEEIKIKQIESCLAGAIENAFVGAAMETAERELQESKRKRNCPFRCDNGMIRNSCRQGYPCPHCTAA